MTRFLHQQRNGKRKRPKEREKQPMGIKTPEQLLAHRELEYLRRPTEERARKLEEARRAMGGRTAPLKQVSEAERRHAL